MKNTLFLFVCLLISSLNYAQVEMGGETDYSEIEADGTIEFHGAATVWEDLNVFPSATNRGATDAPTWGKFRDDESGSIGSWLWWFNHTKREEVFFTVQIPHSYKEGSDLYPHVHWTTKSSNSPETNNVEWGLEYTVSSIGGVFGPTTIITGKTVISSITDPAQYQHLITTLPTIDGTGIGISAIISCRLYRDGSSDNTNDTYGEKVGFLGIDFHYERNTLGSREEFDK